MRQDNDSSLAKKGSRVASGKSATVRLATEDDIPRILELYRELAIDASGAELRSRCSPDEYRRVFAQIRSMPGHQLLVLEIGGLIVGTTVLLIVPNLGHGALPWAMVENVVVDHRYRHQGYGRLLMEYAVARAREAGCYRLLLSTNKKRRGAHRFYRSLGFDAYGYGFRIYF